MIVCALYVLSEENALHVMRDCPIARSVWLLVSQGCVSQDFFTSNLHDWLLSNIRLLSSKNGVPWAVTFGATVTLWHQRNDAVFSLVEPSPRILVFRIQRLAHDITRSFSVDQTLGGRRILVDSNIYAAWK